MDIINYSDFKKGVIMNTRQLVGLMGTVLLIIGVFVPIIHLPLIGDLNYFSNGEGDGIYILGLTFISLLFIFFKLYRALWFTIFCNLCIMSITLNSFFTKLAELKAEMNLEMADNPFRDITETYLQAVNLQWGWGVLAGGTLLLIVCSLMRDSDSN